jgi:hypothetical protein
VSPLRSRSFGGCPIAAAPGQSSGLVIFYHIYLICQVIFILKLLSPLDPLVHTPQNPAAPPQSPALTRVDERNLLPAMATQPGIHASARSYLAPAMLRAWCQTAQLRSPNDDRGPQLWPGAASLYGFTDGHLIDMLRERIVLLGVVVTTIASVAELDRLGLTGYALPHALDTQYGLPCPRTGPNDKLIFVSLDVD